MRQIEEPQGFAYNSKVWTEIARSIINEMEQQRLGDTANACKGRRIDRILQIKDVERATAWWCFPETPLPQKYI